MYGLSYDVSNTRTYYGVEGLVVLRTVCNSCLSGAELRYFSNRSLGMKRSFWITYVGYTGHTTLWYDFCKTCILEFELTPCDTKLAVCDSCSSTTEVYQIPSKAIEAPIGVWEYDVR